MPKSTAPKQRPAPINPPTAPSKELHVFPNPHDKRDYVIQFQIPEFTCHCPLTGQPDFAHLTIDMVAARAGAARATVYRRWATKADLVLAAAARLQGGAACRELGPCMPEGDWQTRYRLREKLQRHTVDQGWATHDKAAGDFDEI